MNTQSVSTIKSFNLSGPKLDSAYKNNLTEIERLGKELYELNKKFIKENVEDNWFVAIDPVNATLIASLSPIELYKYTQTELPDTVFYFVGLLKSNLVLEHVRPR